MQLIKSPFALREKILVMIHAGQGEPVALRFDLQQAGKIFLFLCSVVLLCFFGTLFFFRELEVNRHLQDRVLVLENEMSFHRLGQQSIQTPALTATTTATATPAVEPVREETPVVVSNVVRARVADFTVDCLEGTCTIHLGMVPTRSGTTAGSLVVILETELPRIGMGNPGTAVRKRYFLYPGEKTVDELSMEQISRLDRKSYRFSRALQNTISFKVERTLRPIAANAYLYDEEGTLLVHERRAIKSDE